MTFRMVLGAVVALEFAIGAASAQDPTSSLSGFAPTPKSKSGIPSLSGSATDSMTLNLDAEQLLGLDPPNLPAAWKLTLTELSSGPESVKMQPGLVITAAPEPSTSWLLGLGGLAMARLLRRRKSQRLRGN